MFVRPIHPVHRDAWIFLAAYQKVPLAEQLAATAAQLYPGIYIWGYPQSCWTQMGMLPGNSPLSHLNAQVDAKLAEFESRRATYSESDPPTWPSGAKIIRVVLLVVVVIVLMGWVLTALNR